MVLRQAQKSVMMEIQWMVMAVKVIVQLLKLAGSALEVPLHLKTLEHGVHQVIIKMMQQIQKLV